MTDPDLSRTLRRMAREVASVMTSDEAENVIVLEQFARDVASAVEEAIATDPDRYKGFKKRIIAQAEAAVRQELAPYLQHKDGCAATIEHSRFTDCTCGLTALKESR